MIKDLKIRNLRGIREADISDFKRINVFFGKNNVGKSTVLEAIFVLSGQSNPDIPMKINRLRDFYGVSSDDLSYFFYNSNIDNEIEISWIGDENRSVKISAFRQELGAYTPVNYKMSSNTSTSADISYGLNLNYSNSSNDRSFLSSIRYDPSKITKDENRVHKGGWIFTMPDEYKEKLIAKYLPTDYAFQNEVKKPLEEVVKDNEEYQIIEVLRLLDHRISGISVLSDGIYLKVADDKPLVPINFWGDGLRKLLGILVSIYECKGGILLVDEMDNGFHFSFIPELWKSVYRMAKKCNTQLFVTTHSLDLLNGLSRAFSDEPEAQEHLRGYKLIHSDNGKLESVKYDYNQLVFALSKEIEVR